MNVFHFNLFGHPDKDFLILIFELNLIADIVKKSTKKVYKILLCFGLCL